MKKLLTIVASLSLALGLLVVNTSETHASTDDTVVIQGGPGGGGIGGDSPVK